MEKERLGKVTKESLWQMSGSLRSHSSGDTLDLYHIVCAGEEFNLVSHFNVSEIRDCPLEQVSMVGGLEGTQALQTNFTRLMILPWFCPVKRDHLRAQ